jgi:hypothetical protein
MSTLRYICNEYDPARPDAKKMMRLDKEEMHDLQGQEQAWQRKQEWLKGKVIGEPQATSSCSVEELKKIGMVGIYIEEESNELEEMR